MGLLLRHQVYHNHKEDVFCGRSTTFSDCHWLINNIEDFFFFFHSFTHFPPHFTQTPYTTTTMVIVQVGPRLYLPFNFVQFYTKVSKSLTSLILCFLTHV